MNKEIKFREWVDNGCKNDGKPYPYMNYEPEFHGCINKIFSESGVEPSNPYFCKVTYMQYTGFKDKNNSEIYEGDIVRLTERNYTDCSKEELESIKTSIQLVAYDYGTFGLRKNVNGTGLRPFIWLVGTDYDIEVIGNIYENPELLEGEGNEC